MPTKINTGDCTLNLEANGYVTWDITCWGGGIDRVPHSAHIPVIAGCLPTQLTTFGSQLTLPEFKRDNPVLQETLNKCSVAQWLLWVLHWASTILSTCGCKKENSWSSQLYDRMLGNESIQKMLSCWSYFSSVVVGDLYHSARIQVFPKV